ncbi:hypothetical protein K010075C41_03470 [Sellimonas intestinalis]
MIFLIELLAQSKANVKFLIYAPLFPVSALRYDLLDILADRAYNQTAKL